MYYTYMVRCQDNSIYTGITTDLERRMQEHNSQNEKSAKYTKRHKIKNLEMAWSSEDKIQASKLEYHIKKRLTKLEKENLIQNYTLLKQYSKDKIESSNYKKIRKTTIEKINKNLNN